MQRKKKEKAKNSLFETKSAYYQLLKKTTRKNKLSFFIGLITFIIFSIIGINFYLKNLPKKPQKIILQVKKSEKSIEKNKKNYSEVKKHRVKEGESLWQIAEKYYGSGFNAYDIALANKIANPNLIYINQELILPNVKSKTPTVGETIGIKTELSQQKNKNYIVKNGDYLWKIALEHYGDGYAWIKIASYNKIKNPNLIEPGMVIILP